MARGGVESVFLGALGDDAHSSVVLDALGAAGVDTSLVRRTPRPTGVALVLTDPEGLGAPAAVVTLGADGAAGADADGDFLVPAEAVDVVDTTGAGDAFAGALAAALAGGASLRAAVEAGCRAGAVAATVPGAQGTPS